MKPEDVSHFEVGVKTEPSAASLPTSPLFNTGIDDFQTQVVNAQVGVLRGYLANAEKVRVRGVEFDGNARMNQRFQLHGALAYTDGIYVSFPDAPPPLEDTGGPQVKDISGSVLSRHLEVGVLPRRRVPPSRATSSASPASSSRASTSTIATTSRRARRRRST